MLGAPTIMAAILDHATLEYNMIERILSQAYKATLVSAGQRVVASSAAMPSGRRLLWVSRHTGSAPGGDTIGSSRLSLLGLSHRYSTGGECARLAQ